MKIGSRRIGGFTLIELLVVIAIIALLVGILLPSLASARNSARAVTTASNARQVAIGVATYTATSQALFPPSYVYGSEPDSMGWKMADQQESNPSPANGYVHWSYSLFGGDGKGGGVPEDAFKSPFIPTKGGLPATNPGANSDDWDPGQVNDQGQTTPSNPPSDRQVKRIAFMGNAAIFPRNKFVRNGGEQRINQLVRDAWIQNPSKSILACEIIYKNGNGPMKTGEGVIKSHRPVTPFYGISAGGNPYAEPTGGAGTGFGRFRYPRENEIQKVDDVPDGSIEGDTPWNVVGRQQPNKDKFGGGSQFAFVDGHVEQLTLWDSMQQRKWGDRFWSITGDNRVDIRTTP